MSGRTQTMKIHPRYYPAIILISFVVFALIGFLLGFRPQHGGSRESSMIPFPIALELMI
jgi:hypothetical protein